MKFIFLLFEIKKLYKKCQNLNLEKIDNNLTVEKFLSENKYSKDIRNLHIYPMISSIWSTDSNNVKNFPFVSFVQFFNNHGLFNLKNRPQWKYVVGGSYNYIRKLVNKNLFKIHTDYKIVKVTRKNKKIQLIGNNEEIKIFDKVVFATHADQAINLLEDISNEEKNILSNFKYSKNKAYLHTDENFMPINKIAWSSWNFLQDEKKDQFSLTYWMNKLQKIDTLNNYFVSVNPDIEPNKVIDTTFFEHPIFSTNTLRAQKKLGSIQGNKNTFFCGAYCGYGFHEDGIQSAAYIANRLNLELPWKRSDDFKTRLNY